MLKSWAVFFFLNDYRVKQFYDFLNVYLLLFIFFIRVDELRLIAIHLGYL